MNFIKGQRYINVKGIYSPIGQIIEILDTITDSKEIKRRNYSSYAIHKHTHSPSYSGDSCVWLSDYVPYITNYEIY